MCGVSNSNATVNTLLVKITTDDDDDDASTAFVGGGGGGGVRCVVCDVFGEKGPSSLRL